MAAYGVPVVGQVRLGALETWVGSVESSGEGFGTGRGMSSYGRATYEEPQRGNQLTRGSYALGCEFSPFFRFNWCARMGPSGYRFYIPFVSADSCLLRVPFSRILFDGRLRL